MSTGFTTRTCTSSPSTGDAVVGMIAHARKAAVFAGSEARQRGRAAARRAPGRASCGCWRCGRRHRNGLVFRGLVESRRARGPRAGLRPGASFPAPLRQAKLYRHLGFSPFGHAGRHRGGALSADVHHLSNDSWRRRPLRRAPRREPVSFLPGPVPLAPDVRAAFERPPQYSPRRASSAGVPPHQVAAVRARRRAARRDPARLGHAGQRRGRRRSSRCSTAPGRRA